MAWNPSPDVAVARDAATKLGGNRCIVLWLTADGRIGMASFGETKQLCAETGRLGDVAFNAVMSEMEKQG